MPAKSGGSQFDYPEYAKFHLRSNPGYDFIRFIGWLDEAPPKKFNHVFAAYARNPLGVIIASCAIEGYINYVGHHVDPELDKFTKGRSSVRERIERITAGAAAFAKEKPILLLDASDLVAMAEGSDVLAAAFTGSPAFLSGRA